MDGLVNRQKLCDRQLVNYSRGDSQKELPLGMLEH
jgi:hypothetical protein